MARTQPLSVNHFWPVTLSWGCVITVGYLVCALLGMAGRIGVIPWVFPILIGLAGWPLHWYLRRKVCLRIEQRGVRPRFRMDLMICWLSITGMGLLWTAGLGISGHWSVLCFAWGSLIFIGYVLNGVLLSREWLWAGGVLLASLIGAFLAGPNFYWLPGIWIGGTAVLAGLLGRRNARRQIAHA